MKVAPRRRIALGVAAVAMMLFQIEEARAERGALSVQIGPGGRVDGVRAPPSAHEGGAVALVASPRLLASARYALTHDLELGIAADLGGSRRVAHEGVALDAPGGPFDGTLVHDHGVASVQALVRIYLLGLDWRAYVEPTVGWSRTEFRRMDHRRPSPDGSMASYGLDLPDFTMDALSAGAGLGLEHVWDKVALGASVSLAGLFAGGAASWAGAFGLFFSYDFYP